MHLLPRGPPWGPPLLYSGPKNWLWEPPVNERLAPPTMGWISTNALSKLLHLPLRCFDSLFTVLLDCRASYNFIYRDLVNRISNVTPTKVNLVPIWLADHSVMTSDHSFMTSDHYFSLPIRFTLYHICKFFFHIVPTLTHGTLLGMEWFSLFSPVVNWTSWVLALTIDGESLELKCITLQYPPITISTVEQFNPMLSDPKCKCKAIAVYICPLEGAPEHATLQAMTGHPDLSVKPA